MGRASESIWGLLDIPWPRLKEQLAVLEAERGQVIARNKAEKWGRAPRRGCTISIPLLALWFAVMLLAVGLSNNSESHLTIGAFLFVLGLVGLAMWNSHQHNVISRIDEETRLELSPIDVEIGKIKAQLVEIEAEMDQLAKELRG